MMWGHPLPRTLSGYLRPVLPPVAVLQHADRGARVPGDWKLLFGADYHFTKSSDSIDGLKNANAVIGSGSLPRVSEDTIQGILERAAIKLIGL
jgi:hypothetical protein